MKSLFKKQDPNEAMLPLPTSIADLDKFVADIVKEYGLPNTMDTYDSIATLIMHMPQSAYLAPRRYFGHSALKSLANKAAYDKLAEFRKIRAQKEETLKLKIVDQADTSNIPSGSVDDESKPIQDKRV